MTSLFWSLAQRGRKSAKPAETVRRLLGSRRGAVAVLVGVGLAVLFGFGALAADLGRVYGVRVKLQNAADAAALAGAAKFDPARAREAALEVLRQNGIEEARGDAVEVEVEAPGGQTERVRVTVRRSVPYLLARVLGVEGTEVPARAVARLSSVDEVRGKRSPEAGGGDAECDGEEDEDEHERCEEADDDLEGKIAPLAVREDSWVPGQRVELRPRQGDHGNYYSLALGGRGASTYRENFKYGYEGRLRVGDVLETEPGCMAGPTREALEYRLSRDPQATYDHFDPASPRLVYVAIVEGEMHGRSQVRVKGFAAFFLEPSEGENGGGGNQCVVVGRFVRVVTRGKPGGAYDYGLETPLLEE